LVLVDCGVGCHYRLSDAGLLTELDAVLITHDHMDHFLGLPELLFQAYMESRTKPLPIYAPRIIEDATRIVAPSLYKGIGYTFEFRALQPGLTLTLGSMHVEAYRACHNTANDPYAFKVSFPDISLGFSGDTLEPCRSLLAGLKGVDLMVHEATCSEEYKDPCNHYGHSTTHQALEAGLEVEAGIILLNHVDERFNPRIKEDAETMSGQLGVKAITPEDGYTYRYS